MKSALFITSFAPDLEFLSVCLRSIEKFVTGFEQIVVVVPAHDRLCFESLIAGSRSADGTPITLRHHYEARENGHWWQNCTKVHADVYCPEVDFIAHIDSDCVFCWPVTPASYLRDGKIPIRVKAYADAGQAIAWKPLVDRALGVDAQWETMQWPRLAFWRSTYEQVRKRVEVLHREPFVYHALTHRVAEFPTLGTWALLFQSDGYVPVIRDSADDKDGAFIFQGWSYYRENPQQMQAELSKLRSIIS